jgi:ABC-type transport system substrate-binding protein
MKLNLTTSLILSITLLTAIAASLVAQEGNLSPREEEKLLNNGVDEIPLKDIPLLERAPFDRLFLDEESDNAIFDIVPLDPAERTPSTKGFLVFVFIDDYEEQRYKVARSHIVKIKTYTDLVLEEAERLMQAPVKDEFERAENLVNAFRHYDFLMHHPASAGDPKLKIAAKAYLYTDADSLIRQRKFREALAVVEELYRLDPNYRPAQNQLLTSELLKRIFIKLIDQQLERHEYRLAERYMDDIDFRYKNAFSQITNEKRDAIKALAMERLKQAEALAAQDKGIEAHDMLREARNISPNMQEGRAIESDILKRFPLVKVGTNQQSTTSDPKNLHNWASRRTGRLKYRTLVEYEGQGEDGGVYGFPQGRIERADDSMSMTFIIRQSTDQPGMPHVDGYLVAERLLALQNRKSLEYLPAWAQLMETIEVPSPGLVNVKLNRPHVLPESLLQIPVVPIDPENPPAPNGFYQLSNQEPNRTLYEPRQTPDADGPILPKIMEVYFADNAEMVKELRRGDIDIIDRIFPGDYRALKQQPDIIMERYAVPTIHMLIPKLRSEYMQNTIFRKSLLYAIDRERILKNLLTGLEIPGCQVISGPFPLGIGENDPISYGYDTKVEAAPGDSFHAAILLLLAESQIKLKIEAERKAKAAEAGIVETNSSEGETEDVKEIVLPPKQFILAHPDNNVAAVACELIKQQLGFVGIKCELLKLPKGVTVPETDEYDLLYAEIVMEEPLVDARSLLVESKLVDDLTSPVQYALRELDKASSWSEARRRLHDLHMQCASEAIVLPLWQMTEFYAYRKNLHGVSSQSPGANFSKAGVTNFYENVHRWAIVPASEEN